MTEGILAEDCCGEDFANVEVDGGIIVAANSPYGSAGMTFGQHRGAKGSKCLLVKDGAGWRLVAVEHKLSVIQRDESIFNLETIDDQPI